MRPQETARVLAARAHDSTERCALRAQLRADPMVGTAFPRDRVLLVEQPGPWGRTGLRESRFDAGVAGRLEAQMAGLGVRVLAIRRPGRTEPGQRRTWGYADTRAGRQRLVWGSFDADDELLALDPDTLAHDPSVRDAAAGPSYLVCAHSKHDTCCALRGRPVAAALAEVRPGAVWECSHLGGDRFAANVLVLPLGLLYGRVLPFAAAEFIAAAEAGVVIPALLRGRIGYAPVVQAAMAHAHGALALSRQTDVSLRGSRALGPSTALVRLDTPHGVMDVTIEAEQRPAHRLTCSGQQAASFYAYRAVRLVPAD